MRGGTVRLIWCTALLLLSSAAAPHARATALAATYRDDAPDFERAVQPIPAIKRPALRNLLAAPGAVRRVDGTNPPAQTPAAALSSSSAVLFCRAVLAAVKVGRDSERATAIPPPLS